MVCHKGSISPSVSHCVCFHRVWQQNISYLSNKLLTPLTCCKAFSLTGMKKKMELCTLCIKRGQGRSFYFKQLWNLVMSMVTPLGFWRTEQDPETPACCGSADSSTARHGVQTKSNWGAEAVCLLCCSLEVGQRPNLSNASRLSESSHHVWASEAVFPAPCLFLRCVSTLLWVFPAHLLWMKLLCYMEIWGVKLRSRRIVCSSCCRQECF